MLDENPTEIRTPVSDGMHSPAAERPSWVTRVLVPEMWAAVSIVAMWLAVLFVGVFGPNIVVNNSSGYSNVPVVVVVAFFALLGTVPVARRAFRLGRD